jgi:hypothetical protein
MAASAPDAAIRAPADRRSTDTGAQAPDGEVKDMSGGHRPARDSAPAAVPNRPCVADQAVVTRVGLRMPQEMTFEQWARTGAQLSGVVDSLAWCLGDWLVYGKERYCGRYQHVVHAVGLDYQTLRNYAWVAGRFPPSGRRAGLSLQHHAEVAALPDPDRGRWLDEAESKGWSVRRLRAAIRAARTAGPAQVAKPALLPRIAVPDRRLAWWRRAADRSSQDFEQWVVSALDRAAAQAIEGAVPEASG